MRKGVGDLFAAILFGIGIYILAVSDVGKHGTPKETIIMIGLAIIAIIGLSGRF